MPYPSRIAGAVAVPQWLAMGEVMERYAERGWGDGLEVLGYLVPIQTALVGAVGVLVGALVGGGVRRRNDPGARRQEDNRSPT